MNVILRIIGTPDECDLSFVSSKKAVQYMKHYEVSKPMDFKKVVPKAEKEA